ncbi:MAG: hypothetical protein GXO93_03725 [FCB group bacterium]|nr:hypothetical protein [FCB group bacterium]
MLKKILIIFLFVLITANVIEAQNKKSDSSQVVDTVLYQKQGLLNNLSQITNPINFEKRLTQNPTKALLKSMLIPGWGQLGNRKYVKAGVFMAFDAWFVTSAFHYKKQANDYWDKYTNATEIAERNSYYNVYLDRKDSRNKYTWYSVIVTFVSMFDAYVDAHLSGYPKLEKEKKISWDVKQLNKNGAFASVSFHF